MLRLRMEMADLASTTFTPATPYCELPVSAQVIQQPTSPFGRVWRASRRPLTDEARRLLELVPATGSVPTFLAPEDRLCLDDALDRVQSTPAARIESELAELPWRSMPSPWVYDLARGKTEALADLRSVMSAYFDQVMAPLWPTIQQVAAAELRDRAHQLATEGMAATLNTLGRGIRWRSGVLEVDSAYDVDIELRGRGLRVMPSVWTRPAVALGWSRPTLVYPVPTSSWIRYAADADGPERLAGLLGPTRARVLRTLVTEHTTTGLARSLGISLSAASTHAAVLRRAGLVATRRHGREVRHTLTGLGHRVVVGQ